MPLLRPLVFGLLVSLLPASSSAEALELSQSQLRQLVLDRRIHSAEAIVAVAVDAADETPLDIRGFLLEGRMTYRLLIQRANGSVVELLLDGQNGERISHDSAMGQAVADMARQAVKAPSVVETSVSEQQPVLQSWRSGYQLETGLDHTAGSIRPVVSKYPVGSNGRSRNNAPLVVD